MVPRLSYVLAFLKWWPSRRYEGADHTFYLGEVATFEHGPGDALGYVGGELMSIAELELGVEHLVLGPSHARLRPSRPS